MEPREGAPMAYPDVSDVLDAFGLGDVESAYRKFMCSWCFHVSNFQF